MLQDGKIVPPPVAPQDQIAAEAQPVVHRQGTQAQGGVEAAQTAGDVGLLGIDRVQSQIELALLDPAPVLVVFAVFHSQVRRQHLGDPEAAGGAHQPAIKLVAVAEIEAFGLHHRQDVADEGGQVVAQAQAAWLPAEAGELPGPSLLRLEKWLIYQ